MTTPDIDFDPTLDLKLERTIAVSPSLVWKAWTEPRHLVHWFTPRPWKTTHCDIDLRPGGIFRTVMEGPDGERVDDAGCFLVIEEGRRLVFTDGLGPGFRPKAQPFMTASVFIEPDGNGGTRYTAIAQHKSPEDRKGHEEMGFYDGWGSALDQMVAYLQNL